MKPSKLPSKPVSSLLQKKRHCRRLMAVLAVLLLCCSAMAQREGRVVDDATGEPIARVTVATQAGRRVAVTDSQGRFSIEQRTAREKLSFTAVGYEPKTLQTGPATPYYIIVRLKPSVGQLKEVTVSSKRRSKYSRKNNPAVEMMSFLAG